MIDLFLQSILIVFIYATCWYLISILVKRNDIADVAWGLGYILLCSFYYFKGNQSSREILLYLLVAIWGIRLALYVFLRNKGKKEDFRYLNWRNEWGKYFYIRSYLQVYLLQNFFLLLIISPIAIVAYQEQAALNFIDLVGVLVWMVGFYFQAIGDYQLQKFKGDPNNKGRIMKTGLWKYTRHPNYFGEVTMWWGIFIICLSSPYGFYGIIGPLTISFLILFVSGVPMLEEKYEGNQEFEEYKKVTNRFFPGRSKQVQTRIK